MLFAHPMKGFLECSLNTFSMKELLRVTYLFHWWQKLLRFTEWDGVCLHDNVWCEVRSQSTINTNWRNMSSAGDRNGNSEPDTHYLHSPAALLWQLQLPPRGSATSIAMEPHFGKEKVTFIYMARLNKYVYRYYVWYVFLSLSLYWPTN
jgi:hypothetical protein